MSAPPVNEKSLGMLLNEVRRELEKYRKFFADKENAEKEARNPRRKKSTPKKKRSTKNPAADVQKWRESFDDEI